MVVKFRNKHSISCINCMFVPWHSDAVLLIESAEVDDVPTDAPAINILW